MVDVRRLPGAGEGNELAVTLDELGLEATTGSTGSARSAARTRGARQSS